MEHQSLRSYLHIAMRGWHRRLFGDRVLPLKRVFADAPVIFFRSWRNRRKIASVLMGGEPATTPNGSNPARPARCKPCRWQ
jgi:hypothetical protein